MEWLQHRGQHCYSACASKTQLILAAAPYNSNTQQHSPASRRKTSGCRLGPIWSKKTRRVPPPPAASLLLPAPPSRRREKAARTWDEAHTCRTPARASMAPWGVFGLIRRMARLARRVWRLIHGEKVARRGIVQSTGPVGKREDAMLKKAWNVSVDMQCLTELRMRDMLCWI